MKRFVFILLFFCIGLAASAEVIPPAPKAYFNDYAGVTTAATVSQLNKTLEDFERATSSQIVVAVFRKMESESSIEDYTVRVAQSWKVGQKDKNNGAVLFVFIQNRTMFIQVGYGLEGALPDALCKRIIEDEIKPHFKAGDFDGGCVAGINAMLAAAKGEYRGTGRTVADQLNRSTDVFPLIIGITFVVLIFYLAIREGKKARGNHSYWTMGSGGSSGGWGGGFSGGGGGFSGGGGSFGGGGAGGSW